VHEDWLRLPILRVREDGTGAKNDAESKREKAHAWTNGVRAWVIKAGHAAACRGA
jgi:hypothetical protein